MSRFEMNATRHIFHHTFRLTTTDGNDCVQPVVAVLEDGFFRWHHVPPRWLRPPSERDRAEWKNWVEQSGETARQLADEFYFEHWMFDKL